MTDLTPSSLPSVLFNHLYLVLDDKTYRAIIASDYLRVAFPGMERRSTLTAAGESWSGTYYYCRESYLEFFGASSSPWTNAAGRGGHWQPGAQEGWAGLAFSTAKPGGTAVVRHAMRRAFDYNPHSELRQLRVKDQTIDWFHMLRLSERLSLGSFESWLMEYHPDIFAYKGLSLPASGELTTRAYLASWNQPRSPVQAADGAGAEEAGAEEAGAEEAGAENAGAENAGADGPDSSLPSSDGSTPAAKTAQPSTALEEEDLLIEEDPFVMEEHTLLTTDRQRFMKEKQREAKNRSIRKDHLEQKTLPPPEPVFSNIIGADIHMDAQRAERFAEVLALLGFVRSEGGCVKCAATEIETENAMELTGNGFTLRICPEDTAPSGYRLSAVRLAMSRPSVAPMTFVFAPRSRLVLNEDNTAEWVFGV